MGLYKEAQEKKLFPSFIIGCQLFGYNRVLIVDIGMQPN